MTPGTKQQIRSVALTIAVTTVLVGIGACDENPVKRVYSVPENKPPVAVFSVQTDTGDRNTVFVVDASASTDMDDPDDYLWYRWDWDHQPERYSYTDYRSSSIDSHQYEIEGEHTIRLQVMDPGGNTGFCERQVFVSGRTKWVVPIGTGNTYFTNQSSAAIGPNGVVYVGSGDAALYAISPEGETLWKISTGGDVDSSPAVSDDGTIYFGSVDGKVYAVSPDGQLLWTYQTDYKVNGSPGIGIDGTVYIASDDGYLYAISSKGNYRWKYRIDHHSTSDKWNPPAIGPDGTIYVGSRRGLFYALSPGGDLRWKYSCGGYRISSPAMDADGRLYAKATRFPEDDLVFALSRDGHLLWETPIPHIQYTLINSSPALGPDGTIYIGGYDGRVYALNQNGTIVWTFDAERLITSSPAVGDDGTIYIGTMNRSLSAGGSGLILALNPDGTLLWDYHIRGDFESSPALGSNVLYALADTGHFYAIEVPSAGLADSPWPKFRGNAMNTGRR